MANKITYDLAKVEMFVVKMEGVPLGMVMRNLRNNRWTPLKREGFPLKDHPSRREATKELLRWSGAG